MILDGRTIVSKNYVTTDDTFDFDEQVQPNGVDLRADKFVEVIGKPILPREGKLIAKDVRVNEVNLKDGYWDLPTLNSGHYVVNFRENVSIPDGFCAIIVSRSSMLRVGAFLTSALWDTGFQGRLGAVLRIVNPIQIEYGARLGQVIFHQSRFNGHRYNGTYQGATSQTAFDRLG